ncbi:MAG TPA: acyl-CoA synthetase, partial [Kribbellaceae bacterium]
GFPGTPRPGTVGQRLPYQPVKAVRVAGDGTWEDLPAGETGTLVISGPTVFPGYVVGRGEHGHVLDGLGKLVDGWLDTGDLAAVDEDGFVRLAGRAKDLIIRGGHNIDPAIVEDALLAHPGVTAAAAVGRPDVHAGEVPVAYVTVTAPAAVTGPELVEWAAERVAEPAAAPKEVVVLDALPVTDVGKPYKLPLRADAARRELSRALDGLDPVPAVYAAVDDGSLVATVEVCSLADEAAVIPILDRYAVAWKIVVKP